MVAGGAVAGIRLYGKRSELAIRTPEFGKAVERASQFMSGLLGSLRRGQPSREVQRPAEEVVQTEPVAVIATGEAMAVAVDSDAVDLPWMPRPDLLARASVYDAQGQFRKSLCRCNAVINTVNRGAASIGDKAEMRVYPDLIGTNGRPMGCLMIGIALLLSLPFLLLSPLALLQALFGLVLYPFTWLLGLILQKVLMEPATRFVREHPKHWLSLWILYNWSPLIPRVWERGDIVQVIRVDLRRFICGKRSLVLLVQDDPLPRGLGCANLLAMGILPKRRIDVLTIDKGSAEADAAADAAAEVLGLPVLQAIFVRSRLILP